MNTADQSGQHLALLIPSLGIGGAERSMLTLARAWCEMGLRVDMVTVLDGGDLRSELPEGVRHIPLIHKAVMRSPIVTGLAALRGLVSYLRSTRPAALLSSVTGANLLAVVARRLSGVPCRVVLREASVARNTSGSLRRFAVTWAYRHADGMIAVGQGVARDLVGEFSVPAARVRQLPTPVDLGRVRALSEQAPCHPWFGQDETPLILAVGRLVPVKDYGTLIRAIARLRARCRARLLILGEGPERHALQSLVTELGLGDFVALPGGNTNPYPYIAHAQVLVLSSRWEGLPVVMIEAMALGTPVVATDCPSGPRELLHDGALGSLVPVGDSAALADAIQCMLDFPTDSNALRTRAQDFEVGASARAYLEVLLGRSEGVA